MLFNIMPGSSDLEVIGRVALALARGEITSDALARFVNAALPFDETSEEFPVASSSEVPLWLQTKEEIEAFIAGHVGVAVDKVNIISGLDKLVISSPEQLNPELVNVHRKDDPNDWLFVEEKCGRAAQVPGTSLGFREALLCWKQCEKIHTSWHAYWVYFCNAIVEINGNRYVVRLVPRADGCDLSFFKLDAGSLNDFRFARLRDS